MRTEPEIIAGVTLAAASSQGNGWVCTRTAAGNYTLTFPGVRRAVVSFASATSIGYNFIVGGAGTPSQQLVTNNTSNIAADTALSFTARVSR